MLRLASITGKLAPPDNCSRLRMGKTSKTTLLTCTSRATSLPSKIARVESGVARSISRVPPRNSSMMVPPTSAGVSSSTTTYSPHNTTVVNDSVKLAKNCRV
jgi:hypothetical protein